MPNSPYNASRLHLFEKLVITESTFFTRTSFQHSQVGCWSRLHHQITSAKMVSTISTVQLWGINSRCIWGTNMATRPEDWDTENVQRCVEINVPLNLSQFPWEHPRRTQRSLSSLIPYMSLPDNSHIHNGCHHVPQHSASPRWDIVLSSLNGSLPRLDSLL